MNTFFTLDKAWELLETVTVNHINKLGFKDACLALNGTMIRPQSKLFRGHVKLSWDVADNVIHFTHMHHSMFQQAFTNKRGEVEVVYDDPQTIRTKMAGMKPPNDPYAYQHHSVSFYMEGKRAIPLSMFTPKDYCYHDYEANTFMADTLSCM